MIDAAVRDLEETRTRSLQLELAQIRAKGTMTLLLGAAPPFRWRYSPQWVAQNTALMHAALRRIAVSDPSRVAELDGAALFAAQAWEGLANLGEVAYRPTALLNAALAYELAGYQANASCLARAATNAQEWTTNPTFLGLVSAFVQRLFLRTRVVAAELQLPPDEALLEQEFAHRAGAGLTAQAVSLAADYFLSGHGQQYELALSRLDAAERLFLASGDVVGSSQVSNLKALLPTMRRRSTWTVIGDASPSKRWNRYVRVLARGLKLPAIEGRSISELWPSQLAALEHGLLAGNADLTIRMPTSAGKTRIAEMAIVKALVGGGGSRCLYVAPFRALASEVSESFSYLFADLGYSSSSVVGGLENDEFDQVAAQQDDVVVLTPEKLDLVLRLSPQALRDVRLVVLDEGQLVGDEGRGVKYELLVSRMRRALPDARFLFMSAVVPDTTLSEFARWLGTGDEGIVTSSWRPALLRVAALNWRDGRGFLHFVALQPDAALESFVPDVVAEERFEYVNERTQRTNTRRFPTDKSEVAAAAAYRFAARGPVLIFTTQTNWAESIGKALERRVHLGMAVDDGLPRTFQSARIRREDLSSQVAAREWLGSDHLVTRLLEFGIAVHHGRLPDAVRLAIETDFRERRLAVLVATTTLAQGVNLPVSTTIIHSVWRSDPNGERTRIPAREYWNIAGRTGRAGEETEGTLIHLLLNDLDRRDFEFFLARRDSVEEIESALHVLLRQLVQRRISPDLLERALDPEILALLVEEAVTEERDLIDATLDASLCAVQTERSGLEIETLKRTVRWAARNIRNRVPDPDRRRLFSTTGLSSVSCEQILRYVLDHRAEVADLFERANLADLQPISDLLLEGVVGIDEMQSDLSHTADTRQVVDLWLRGTPVASIATQANEEGVEDLARFVEEYAAYLLPWGVSALIRIATSQLALIPTPTVRSFPAMLKWGVPTVEATWAHASGITSRQVAIGLGERYASEALEPSPRDFRRWLHGHDVDGLAAELNISGRVLQETARAIVSSRRSDALNQLEAGTLFPAGASVKVQRRIGPLIPRRLAALGPLSLARDYFSGVNRNSIALLAGQTLLGYLPWDLSTALGPEMDGGMELRVEFNAARIEETDTWLDVTVSADATAVEH
jgi:helicase